MSHEATMWAVKVRGISPAEARVLWHLADCHNPVFGCFPTQEYLAENCELDERSIRRLIYSLRDKGHINWIEQREKNKRRANRYSLAFEPGFRPVETMAGGEFEADNLSGSNEADATGQTATGEPDISDSLNRTPESAIEPVREPVKEPVTEREARERVISGSGTAPTGTVNADLIKRVQKFCTGEGYREGAWPKWAKSTIGHIAGRFAGLTAAEQDEACEWRDPFLAKCRREGITTPMPVANYFRDKVWNMLEPSDKASVRPVAGGAPVTGAGKVIVPVFGPVFAAARAWALVSGPAWFDLPEDLRERVQATYEAHIRRGPQAALNYLRRLGLSEENGRLVFPADFERQERARRTILEGYPEVNRLHDAAKDRVHVTVAPVFERLKDLCEPVPIGSPMWERWRDHDEAQGWPFVPTPSGMKVVFFPKGGPDGLDEFRKAASAVMESGEGHVDAAAE
jgi:hypothetical protein